jgi:pleiotropic regulator 1
MTSVASLSSMERTDAKTLLSNSRKQTQAVFGKEYLSSIEVDEETSHRAKLASKIRSEYENVKELPFFLTEKQGKAKQPSAPKQATSSIQTRLIEDVQRSQRYTSHLQSESSRDEPSTALTVRMPTSRPSGMGQSSAGGSGGRSQVIRRDNYQPVKPEWHAPWKLRTVIRYIPILNIFNSIVVISAG